MPESSTGVGFASRFAPWTLPPTMAKDLSEPVLEIDTVLALAMKSPVLPVALGPLAAKTVPPEIFTAFSGSVLLPETAPT